MLDINNSRNISIPWLHIGIDRYFPRKLDNQCLSNPTFKITTQDNTLLGVGSTYIDVLEDCKKNNFLKSVEHW